jgi:two-component system, sensor histidine kinase and response regulator
MTNHSILIIDDEPNNFEVIETLLTNNNYDVYYASNGEEALANLDTFNPDVILLDLMMPGMDGLEVCQRLKLMRKWKSIPIIMVTAAAGKTVLSECLDAGADDFINKPVDGLELRARIRSMLRLKKQFDRIESLTKLQQKNIILLENELGELGCYLAVGFANELNTPLSSIVDRLEDVKQNIHNLTPKDVLTLVNSASNSALELEQLTSKFWIYLELALEKKQFDHQESCNIKKVIEQISILKAQYLHRDSDLSISIESAKVAVTEQHCEWIVKELVDNAFNSSTTGVPIEIGSQVVDRLLHLWIKTRPFPEPVSSDFSLENRTSEERELELGLKIVKKIVNIYDGIFSISTGMGSSNPLENCHNTTVYITLPLI